MGVLRPDLLIKCIVPVIMAGIIAIYGLVVSVLISSDSESSQQAGGSAVDGGTVADWPSLQSKRQCHSMLDSSNSVLVSQ